MFSPSLLFLLLQQNDPKKSNRNNRNVVFKCSKEDSKVNTGWSDLIHSPQECFGCKMCFNLVQAARFWILPKFIVTIQNSVLENVSPFGTGFPCVSMLICTGVYIYICIKMYSHTSFFQSWWLMVVSKWIRQLATRNDLRDHSSPTQLAVDYSCCMVTDWGDASPFSSCDKGRFTRIPGSPKMFCCLPVDFHCWKGWAFEHPK